MAAYEQGVSARREQTVSSRGLQILAVGGLVAVGLILLVLGAVLILSDGAPGSSTVAKQSTTTTQAPAKDQPGTTTTKVSSSATTSPGKPSRRSESVAAALFGLGALVFLVGVFFGRIQEVTLPGGAGFKLAPETDNALKEAVAEKVKSDPELPDDDPSIAISLYQQAAAWLGLGAGAPTALVARPKASRPAAPTSGGPDQEEIRQAVDRAAQQVRSS